MESNTSQKRKIDFLIKFAYFGVIIAICYFIFKYFLNLVMPFFIATIMAAIARPLARLLCRDTRKKKDENGNIITVKKKVVIHYNIAAVVSVILLFILILGLLSALVIPLISFITEFFIEIPKIYSDTIAPALSSMVDKIQNLPDYIDGPIAEIIQDAIPNVVSSLGSFIANFSGKVIVWASSFATRLPSVLLKIIITMIATVFIALDFDRIKMFIKLNLKSNTLNVVRKVKNTLVTIIWQFIRSYFIIFVITMTEIFIGLLIIGYKAPLLIAFLIALFDAFPIVGSGMILLPWSIITIITSDTIRGISLFILYVIVVIARQIIEPRIVGKQVGLRPVVTLVCMFVGSKLFGGIGLFGLPITAAIISDMNKQDGFRFFNVSEEDNEKAGSGLKALLKRKGKDETNTENNPEEKPESSEEGN